MKSHLSSNISISSTSLRVRTYDSSSAYFHIMQNAHKVNLCKSIVIHRNVNKKTTRFVIFVDFLLLFEIFSHTIAYHRIHRVMCFKCDNLSAITIYLLRKQNETKTIRLKIFHLICAMSCESKEMSAILFSTDSPLMVLNIINWSFNILLISLSLFVRIRRNHFLIYYIYSCIQYELISGSQTEDYEFISIFGIWIAT